MSGHFLGRDELFSVSDSADRPVLAGSTAQKTLSDDIAECGCAMKLAS